MPGERISGTASGANISNAPRCRKAIPTAPSRAVTAQMPAIVQRVPKCGTNTKLVSMTPAMLPTVDTAYTFPAVVP